MFYNRDEIIEMYDTVQGKENWHLILLTSELFGDNIDDMSSKEMIKIIDAWGDAVAQCLSRLDAAYPVNPGNIFALIHAQSLPDFEENIKNIRVFAKNKVNGVRVSMMILNSDEIKFLLKIS